MLLTRKRRAGTIRSKLLEAVAQTEGLGLTVVGVYDALVYASTSSWVDARGATSGGPTITLTGSPTLSNGVYTFNGTDQYGRATGGRLSEITGTPDSAVVVIGVTPQTGTHLFALSVGASLRLRAFRSTTTLAVRGNTVSASATNLTGVRVIHARRKGTAAGVVGVRFGDDAEVTVSDTLTTGTIDRLTIGADSSDIAAQFGDCAVRTVVVIKGDYTSAAQDIWNAYGQLRGATL